MSIDIEKIKVTPVEKLRSKLDLRLRVARRVCDMMARAVSAVRGVDY